MNGGERLRSVFWYRCYNKLKDTILDHDKNYTRRNDSTVKTEAAVFIQRSQNVDRTSFLSLNFLQRKCKAVMNTMRVKYRVLNDLDDFLRTLNKYRGTWSKFSNRNQHLLTNCFSQTHRFVLKNVLLQQNLVSTDKNSSHLHRVLTFLPVCSLSVPETEGNFEKNTRRRFISIIISCIKISKKNYENFDGNFFCRIG